eukprot:Gregarina_sp_Poly_1__4936@NODE_2619_length_1909_cov_387_745928_g1661_i0_p1_GENE_NODE_2619_length_1909_cov_387_745928_g1661_i0NODE_2619_length_1909_cov_387_745928_g1661_i0_p1_ORF_typecomplete_len463_score58_96Branch/PF02485_21/0_00015_NODE_2619_length_1909_cov_387_745928_g1661_i0521440
MSSPTFWGGLFVGIICGSLLSYNAISMSSQFSQATPSTIDARLLERHDETHRLPDDSLLMDYVDGHLHLRSVLDIPATSMERRPPKNWSVIARTKMDRERRCALAPSWPVAAGEPRGFALLFATVRNLNTNIVWERWLADAYDWIHEQGLEDADVPPEESRVLRSFVHYAPAFDRDGIRDLMPNHMRHAPIVDPVECVWANTAPCSYRIFQYAYETWAEGGYFNLLSHNSIPLKKFSEMYSAFLEDQKARIALAEFCFDDTNLVPKSATWRSLPREMVRATLERQDWKTSPWLSHGPQKSGVPDEGHNWKPIMAEFGEGFAEMIHPGPMQNVTSAWKTDEAMAFHLDCWGPTIYCRDLGEGDGAPTAFSSLNAEKLRERLRNPNVWFLRKVDDWTSVKVENGDKQPVSDFLFEFWESPHKALEVPYHDAIKDPVPISKGASSLKDLVKMWKEEKVFGLKKEV